MYSLQIPPRLYCGNGSIEALQTIIKNAQRIAVFTDCGVRKAGICDIVQKHCKRTDNQVQIFDAILPEPSIENASNIISDYLRFGADVIIGVGGGSVMDIAKLSSLFDGTETYSLHTLAENPLSAKKKCRTVLIPTTAGTGAEATANAVLAFPAEQRKRGIVTSEMHADTIILDAGVIASAPDHVLSAACIDALAHAIECFTSLKATPLSDFYSLEALKLIFRSAVKGCIERVPEALEELQLAAYYAGCAISGSGTTAVHALSYPLGGRYHIPHGIANAILLLPVMEFNAPYCQKHFSIIYDVLSREQITRSCEEKTQWVLNQLQALIEALKIPPTLARFGVSRDDIPKLVTAALQVTRLLQNNRRPVTAADAQDIYQQIIVSR